jgi:hypothetical protein
METDIEKVDREVTKIQYISYTAMIVGIVWLLCGVIWWIFTKGCGC